MQAKACLNCRFLGQLNLARTGRRCHGFPSTGELIPVVKSEALTTFYCSRWSETTTQPQAKLADTVHTKVGEAVFTGETIDHCEDIVDRVLRVLPH